MKDIYYILEYYPTGDTYIFSTALKAKEYAIKLLKAHPQYEELQDEIEEDIKTIEKQSSDLDKTFDSGYTICYCASFMG